MQLINWEFNFSLITLSRRMQRHILRARSEEQCPTVKGTQTATEDKGH